MLQAGDARVQAALEATASQAKLPLEVVEDPHFFVKTADFSDWLAQRKQPRLEHFYRALRCASQSLKSAVFTKKCGSSTTSSGSLA